MPQIFFAYLSVMPEKGFATPSVGATCLVWQLDDEQEYCHCRNEPHHDESPNSARRALRGIVRLNRRRLWRHS
jgi:hypothetical protein